MKTELFPIEDVPSFSFLKDSANASYKKLKVGQSFLIPNDILENIYNGRKDDKLNSKVTLKIYKERLRTMIRNSLPKSSEVSNVVTGIRVFKFRKQYNEDKNTRISN